MAEIREVTDGTFDEEVLQTGGLVLVDFGAEWCHPCKQLDPVVEELAADWEGQVKVAKLDIDQNVGTTMRYQVMGVPTLILFKSGEPVARLGGFMPKARIVEKLSPYFD